MNKCINCGKRTNNNKFCSISCQNKYQGKDRANKKYGEIKDFIVKCEKCGKEFIVNEREKLFKKDLQERIGVDVFVHISAVQRANMAGLDEGQKVSYDVVQERGKSSAGNLKAV